MANALKTYVFDLDGVIYRGNEPQPHAADTIRELRNRGRKVFFLTNNATKSRESFVDKLASMGIPVPVDDVMTSAHATAIYLREQGAAGKRAFIVGEDGLAHELESVGLEVFRDRLNGQIDYVVAGLDRKFTYDKLAMAQRAIMQGAQFIATNTDATFPLEEGLEAPGGGSIVSAIRTAGGVEPLVIGKPETYSTRKVLEIAKSTPEESVMIGDRLETDMLTGNRLRMRTVLVLTGISDRETAECALGEMRPERIITDLSELLDESWGGMKRALTVAGSDSSGGAGVQADLKVFADLGVYGLSAVTCVTAQNSEGVRKINKVPPRIVAAQIDAVVRDIGTDACKIGMVYSEQVVSLIAERIKRREIENVVLDPVIFAKEGERLLLARAVDRMKRELIPRCTIVAPNLAEAGAIAKREVIGLDSARDAARIIYGFGAKYVLIKGGHLEGDPIDLLYDGSEFIEFPGKRVEGKRLHGTGCIVTAAITARLALGDTVPEAVKFAKGFVASAIENSVRLGKGKMWYYGGGVSS